MKAEEKRQMTAWLAQDNNSEAITAQRSLIDAIAARHSVTTADVPVVEKPYTRMLHTIRNGAVIKIAEMMVWMAGSAGRELKRKVGLDMAAAMLFEAAHPGWPQKHYGSIPPEWALAHIEVMAEREAAEAAQHG